MGRLERVSYLITKECVSEVVTRRSRLNVLVKSIECDRSPSLIITCIRVCVVIPESAI